MFSPDGATLASRSWSEARLWDVATGTPKATLSADPHLIVSVSFSPDSATLACGNSRNTVGLWDVATGTLKDTLIEDKFLNRSDFGRMYIVQSGWHYRCERE